MIFFTDTEMTVRFISCFSVTPDFGAAALDSAGDKHTGVFTGSRRFIQNHPLILRTKSLTFALFNYTCGTNGLSTPDGLSVDRIDSFTVERDIALVDRSKIDCIIVFFHRGHEYSRYPDEEQRALA
jgi:poly-gamma-glutamate synthesis protein (capsule biosynthesis protein)